MSNNWWFLAVPAVILLALIANRVMRPRRLGLGLTPKNHNPAQDLGEGRHGVGVREPTQRPPPVLHSAAEEKPTRDGQ